MSWSICSHMKGIRIWTAWMVGGILGYGMVPEGHGAFCWAAEAKTPVGKSAAEADLPDMPAPVPKAAPEAEKSPGPAKSESPGEKVPAQPAAQPESAGGKGPAQPSAQPNPAPGEQIPSSPEPPTKPKSKSPAKEKAAEPILEWPVDDAQRKNRAEVPKLLRSGTLTPDQIKFLTEYYTQYGLARWTKWANRAEVRKYRDELLRELAQAEGQAHDQTVQIVMNLLVKMAEGNLHPVARLNAVLALGELNQTEGKPNKPPEPLPAVQPILLQTVQNSQMPEMLRIAALVGLRRHAELGAVADPTKVQWATALIPIVQERSPSGRDAVGHQWLRQLAIELLELLKTAGPNGQVALALIEVLADTNNPISIRVAAARTLGKLDYSQGFPADLNKLLREMGQLALDAVNSELETYQKEKKLLARRLQTHLIGVYNGLSGLQKTASQSKDTADLYQKVLDAIRGCAGLFDKLRDEQGNLQQDEFVKQLAKQKTALSEAIAAPVPPQTQPEKTK